MSDQQSPMVHDPRRHTAETRARLDELIRHLREGVRNVGDPRAAALFETTAEVLGGLKRAYAHYEQGTEEAWRR